MHDPRDFEGLKGRKYEILNNPQHSSGLEIRYTDVGHNPKTHKKEPLKESKASGFLRLLEYTEDEINIANKTSRSSGSVSGKALVPRYVEVNIDKRSSILDFGAGKDAIHSKRLRDSGFKNVTAYDFGSNSKDGLHDSDALSKRYDCVFASNVLNVQSSMSMLKFTLDSIRKAVKPGGVFIGNFPESPRKSEEITNEVIFKELQTRFKKVEVVGGTKRAPVFLAK
jgi:hypothetical protein